MSKKKSEKEAKEKKHAGKKASAKSKKAAIAPEAVVEAPVETAPAPKPKVEKTKAAKTGSVPAKAAAKKLPVCDEDIALRAYFIAERRHKMGWPGDSTGDWVEAERQLKAEAARKK